MHASAFRNNVNDACLLVTVEQPFHLPCGRPTSGLVVKAIDKGDVKAGPEAVGAFAVRSIQIPAAQPTLLFVGARRRGHAEHRTITCRPLQGIGKIVAHVLQKLVRFRKQPSMAVGQTRNAVPSSVFHFDELSVSFSRIQLNVVLDKKAIGQ